ncbi:MAG: flagellar basal body P-ring protein FlgI [Gammaproteobacteria bacterium]|nr:flagellar basal body P-ring protein FlgI [Gammaproteobacteria bacterium]
MSRYLLLSFLAFWLAANNVFAERIKDIASVAGIRSNQLVGYGLVVGLDGSGDSSASFTDDSMRNMLEQLGITLPPGANLPIKNVAAVSLSAELPPFTKPGQKIDVNVSSIGNSKNLRGGTLLMAPLKGADGRVYAVAQGNLVVIGLNAGGNDGSSVTINVPTGGRIPNGATVEREVATSFIDGGNSITLNLYRPDFTTAHRLAETINDTMGLGTAQAMDASSVKVSAPKVLSQKVSYLSMLENLTFFPGKAPARIVVNARSGTVVIGQNVVVQPAVVSHGNLTVTITNDPTISQPPAFSGGSTVVVPKSDVDVALDNNGAFVFNLGVTLDEVVRAVNNIGASPAELVAILEALKAAGSLNAELIII